MVMTVGILTAPLAVFLFAVPLDVGGDPPFSNNKLVNVVNSENQRAPSIAVDSGGDIYIAWEDYRSTTHWDIYFANSTDGGITWSVPNEMINSDATATDQENPSLAVDDAGTLFVAWDNDTAGEEDIGFANSTDGGATWSSPHVIINTDGLMGLPQKNPAIAVNSTNEVYVVWQDARALDWDIYFSKSIDGGATWMDPNIRINNDLVNATQFTPTIAVDNNGMIYTAWEDGRDGNSNIYFAKSADGGSTWSNPNIKVNTNVSTNQNPTITVDSSGNIYIAWQDNRNGHYDIYYAMSSDGGATWSDPNIKVNNEVGTANQRAPSIAVNSTGAIFVVWEDFRWGDYDVYFAVSEDMGTTWSNPNLRVNDDTGSTDQRAPGLAAGPDGSAYIAWQDYRATDNYDIYFAYLLPPPPPATVDFIEITDVPDGIPLTGGIVPTGFQEWGSCSAYNNTAGYLYTVSADWTAEGGTALLQGGTPADTNGIDVGSTEVMVWLNASFGIHTDSVQYTVVAYTVDNIEITEVPDGTQLSGGTVPVGFSEWGSCSAYNNTAGYLYTVSADWTAEGGTALLLGATPAHTNGIDVGNVGGDVWLNASYGISTDSVQYNVLTPEVDYIEITDIPDGTPLAGGSVPVGFSESGTCSAYNTTSGYIGPVSADWTADGGTASLLGATPATSNGIDADITPGDVWLNASFGVHTDSVQYDVLPPTPDYIEITDIPDGAPLAGGSVSVGFSEWGNCSVYNSTSGFITTISANWTAEGGTASLLGATPAVMNGIDVGASEVTVYLNASYGGFIDSIEYTVSGLTVDYIEITDLPGGTPLPGGTVPVGFMEWGNCSAYNTTSGFIGVVNADWITEGGSASLLGVTPALLNGIDVGTVAGDVWLNASYGGHTASVQYTVSSATVDYIQITDIPDGMQLTGGTVLDNFVEWGNCSAYNLTSGYIAVVSATWTVEGGTATRLGSSPDVMAGIDVGNTAGEVWLNASFGGHQDSVQYIVTPPTVDYIEITDVPDGTPLTGGIVPFDFEEWGNCSAYNNSVGFIGLVSADWSAEGGSSSLLGGPTAEFNGITVGTTPGTVSLNATYMGKTDTVVYTVGTPTVDYVIITDVAGGTALPGGTVPVGFSEWSYCSAYNDTTGYIDTQNAAWSVEGGASLLGSTIAETNGIDVGTTPGTVWLNVTYNGFMYSVEYTVSPPEADYIDITDVPDGTPLSGGSVPVGFEVWGNCSLYNTTTGYMGTGDAFWTVSGGNAQRLGDVPVTTMNGIDVGTQAGTVRFSATYNLLSDSVEYTVLEPEVDYIFIMTGAGGSGDLLDTANFTVGDSATFYAAGFNDTTGYVEDVADAVWSVSGGIGTVTTPGASSTFNATAAGVGEITASYSGVTYISNDITVVAVVTISAPGQPTIESKGKDFIEISWPANTETNLGGYRIYRRLSPGDDWSLLSSVGADVTTYKDEGLESGTIYYYALTALDDASNESPLSISVHAETDEPVDDEFPWMILIIIIIIVIVLLLLILGKKKPKDKVIPDEGPGPEEEMPEEEQPSELEDNDKVPEEPIEEDYEETSEGEEEYSSSDEVEEVK